VRIAVAGLLLLVARAGAAEPPDVDLDAALEAARDLLRAVLGKSIAVPEVRVAWRSAGKDKSGTRAWTRRDGDAFSIELAREYAALGALDVEATLAHELFHAVHRHALGARYADVPAWAREGAAVWVAGQAPRRARLLAAYVVRENVSDPLARLVDGLEGRHDLLDYYEDAAAFEAAGEKAPALVRALLRRADPKRAVLDVLRVSFDEFERHGQERARKVLAGHIAVLRRGPSPRFPDSWLPRVRALRRAGKPKDALALLRTRVLEDPRELLAVGEAVALEVALLRELDDPSYEAKRARALANLGPFDVDPAILGGTG